MRFAFEASVRVRAAQDRALARYISQDVAPYSGFHAEALRGFAVSGRDDLARLALTKLADVVNPSALVLRPSPDRIAGAGAPSLRRHLRLARLRGRQGAFSRAVVEPRYKPVHWHDADGVPIGYTADDLDLLAEIGRQSLELAGLDRLDVVVGLLPAGPHLSFWQLTLGARRAGISTFIPGSGLTADAVARLRPSVLAGAADELLRVLEAGRAEGLSFAGLHTLLAIGAPLEGSLRARLATATGQSDPLSVVAWWAPPGVRALWTECRHSHDVHTWPAHELLEVVEVAGPDDPTGHPLPVGADGEVVWTPLGWRGSVLLRLRTGVEAALDDSPCVGCGRTAPRVRVIFRQPPFATVLDHHPGIADWQAELRRVDGSEELLVYLAIRGSGHPGAVLRDLDRQLSATQYVVLAQRALAARRRDHGDARIVDLRT